MTPINQLKTKLSSIADAIRERTGTTDKLTLDQMTEEIEYMPSGDDDNTYILVDEDGDEFAAVLTNEDIDITATPNDIRLGVVAVTDDGIVTGEKEIPSYHTYDGYRIVTNGSKFVIYHADYNYTKIQSIICAFNTSLTDSVAATKVSVYDSVYDVGSTTELSSLTKDDANKSVDFGINNESGGICILRYIMYKEIY